MIEVRNNEGDDQEIHDVNDMLDDIPSGSMAYVKISRRKAMEFADEGKVDHEGKYTIFG